MKKPTSPDPDPLGKPTIFCTECGTELENFCFSGRAGDLEAIRKTLAQCKKSGRFVGEFCAKLFVADPRIQDPPSGSDQD